MEVDQEKEKETVIEREGKEAIKVKYADNTGKKSETSKRRVVRRKFRRFRNSRGRSNYLGRSKTNQNRGYSSNKNQRRQRGVGGRKRGVKIIVRGLTRSATNNDIKSVFEKMGPLRRCGINYNNLGESKGTAEVEYYYRRDAFRACRKLDYKNIRGVPMRLEMREGLRRIMFRRSARTSFRRTGTRSYSTGARRFRTNRTGNRRDSNNRRRVRSAPRRNVTRRNLRNRTGRNSRNDRKYKTYNN